METKQKTALAFGAVTLAIVLTVGHDWVAEASGIATFVLFAWLFVIMLWGSFRAVHHPDCLATKLDEPYGTLIVIEVV